MIKLLKGLIIAFRAHKGQVDKGGKPYILHPIKVALGVKTLEAKTVALLHDVLEDTDYTMKDLRFLNKNQKDALTLLTKNENISYTDYIEAIKKDPIAKAVKISDLKHNSNLNRINVISEKDMSRYYKYNKALKILEDK
ncbi:MAG: GTP pyrophosphokinase [Tissierellia bacterium]|nr:GTP pyrophosphokinase [Tissierellia bacterium]